MVQESHKVINYAKNYSNCGCGCGIMRGSESDDREREYGTMRRATTRSCAYA